MLYNYLIFAILALITELGFWISDPSVEYYQAERG